MTISEDFDRGAHLVAAEPEFDPRLYAKILRRRFPYLVVPAVAIFGIVYWIAQVLPPVYQATATILVESQQIPTDLARPTVSANAAERIQLIEQRLIARDNLLQIARTYGLFKGDALSPSDIVDRIRKATSINQIDVSNNVQPNTQAIGFTVSFEYGDPGTAAKVANEYVTSILQQNIQTRTSRAAETAKFFDSQVASIEGDMAGKERQIVDFKNRNQDSLPETLPSRQSLFSQLQGQIDTIDGRIAVLETQKQLLQQRGPTALDPASNTTEAQLNQLRMQLVQLRAIYSENHPDVKAVEAKISALEKASAAEPPPSGKNDASKIAPSDISSAQLADIDQQIEALKAQEADIKKRSDTIDASIQKTPQTEVALNVLMRDYDGLQQQYSVAKAKAVEAATGEQLEQDRQAERFEVVESATVPSKPVSPNRPRIIFAGAFGSVAVGIGLVALLEMLDKSIRDASDLERRLRIRPISSIPYVTTSFETRRRRRALVLLIAGGLIVIVLALLAVQLFYLPLDLVWQKVAVRLGL